MPASHLSHTPHSSPEDPALKEYVVVRFEMEDKGNYQETLVFFSPLAVQEKTRTTGRLVHVIPPDQRPAAVSSLHAEQVPTVMSVGRVYSNRQSRTPANTYQSTFSAANKLHQINQLLSESHHWKAQQAFQVILDPYVQQKVGRGWGRGRRNAEKVTELNIRLIWAAGRCHAWSYYKAY